MTDVLETLIWMGGGALMGWIIGRLFRRAERRRRERALISQQEFRYGKRVGYGIMKTTFGDRIWAKNPEDR